jgi:2-(1,2-epoxy-1,2-dihydrophenyl)acetyl-CoA isomerase
VSVGVRVERDGAVGVITLDRPDKLNALTLPMFEAVARALAEFREPECRAVLIRGEGRAFCAGDDIDPDRFRDGHAYPFYGQAAPSGYFDGPNPYWLWKALRSYPKPVVAALHGHCSGAGADIALACDLRVAAPDTRLGFPYIRLGYVGGTWLLAKYVGLGRASEILLTGDDVDAATALEWGLVNRVVDPGNLDAEAMALATRLAEGPTRTIGYTKEALNRGLTADLQQGLEYMVWANGFAANTQDRAEAAAAFAERRPPRFTGR